jgi:hypothetical protein
MIGVGSRVIALATEDVGELDASLEEPASFADGLESAVKLQGAGAVAVAK